MRTLLSFVIAFGLLGFSPVLGQNGINSSETVPRGLSSVQIHQLFFERMANSNPRNPFTFQNDLTDAEMAIVNKVAGDCDSKLRPLDDRPVVFEARMRFVKSGEGQENWMSPQLTELKARRELVVLDHVQTLRTSLGEPRFQALENSMQDWYKSLVLVPPATGKTGSPAAIPARAPAKRQ